MYILRFSKIIHFFLYLFIVAIHYNAAYAACVYNKESALDSMKISRSDEKDLVIVSFEKNCVDTVCRVRAKVPQRGYIAYFTLDPSKGFRVCKERKTVEAEEARLGCSKRYTLDYQYVTLSDRAHMNSVIIFETVRAADQDGHVCSNPDSNDGPALASFVSTYEITPQATVYVYELDSYPTIQDAVRAKRKYIPQPAER